MSRLLQSSTSSDELKAEKSSSDVVGSKSCVRSESAEESSGTCRLQPRDRCFLNVFHLENERKPSRGTINSKVWMIPVNLANMSHQIILATSAISAHRTILSNSYTHCHSAR